MFFFVDYLDVFFLLHPPTAAHVVVCVEVHYCVVKCTTFSCTWWSMCITGVVLDRECDDLKYIYMYVQRLLNHGQQQVDFVEECAEKDSECSFFFSFSSFFSSI